MQKTNVQLQDSVRKLTEHNTQVSVSLKTALGEVSELTEKLNKSKSGNNALVFMTVVAIAIIIAAI